MEVLPIFIVTGFFRSFTYCGIDYFESMVLKIERRWENRYGVILTCFVTGTIHLELAHSNTDSAILTIKRLILRRGCQKHISSEFRVTLKEYLNKNKILTVGRE